MSRPTRYGPSTPIAGSSGMTGREVRAFGHPRYNDPDSVSREQADIEDMNYENSIRDRENIENNNRPSRGPASLREMVRRMYYGRGNKKKTRRTTKKRKTRRHKKTRKSRRS